MDNQNAYSHNPPLCRNYSDKFLVFDKGQGCTLYDIKGNQYLDMAAGIAVNALGYGRKDIAEIMSQQAQKLIHCSNLFTSIPTLTLAQKLTAASGYDAVFFGNSGAEANEAALKFARIYSKAQKGEKAVAYLSFHSAFHGRTAGTLSVTPNEKYQKSYRPLLDHCYSIDFNDCEALEATLNKDFAAVIVEPIQGEGGINMISPEFAEKLNQLCERYDIVLIADEIQVGLGRTGFAFASAACGLKPHIITLGKPIAGGLPLGATLVQKKINDVIHPGDHGSTFGGNPVCCAVANAVLDILLNPEFLMEVNEKGAFLKERLEELQKKFPQYIQEVKGMGLIQGIALENIDLGEVMKACELNGLIVLRAGSNVLRLVPPLIITKEEIEKGVSIIEKSLN